MYTYRKRVEQRPENKLIHVSALFRACYRAMIPNRTACLICTAQGSLPAGAGFKGTLSRDWRNVQFYPLWL